MRPEDASLTLLGVARARAKMHEYGVPEESFNEITRSPADLFSLAIGMLGDVAVSINSGYQPNESIDETKSHLLFCARFFDSYFSSRLHQELDPYLLLLAGATYYLADFPGSASVMAQSLPQPCPDVGAGGMEELLAWILRGDFRANLRDAQIEDEFNREIANNLQAFFLRGVNSRRLIASLVQLRTRVYDLGSPRELLMTDLIGAMVRKRLQNSTWLTLPAYSNSTQETWSPALQKPSFIRELWPAQVLLGQQGLYSGASAVIQMPTSAGKTRAVELMIRSAFYTGRTSLAVIVAPFRALCEEIRQSLVSSFSGEGISVDQLTDVQQGDFDLESLLQGRQVLVMTPEKCLYVLRHNPEVTESLGLLVFDEGHQFDSGSRGVTYELLLTSLKSSVRNDTQKVLVSAVLSNAQAIADWLNGTGGLVVSGTTLLPTVRALAFASWKRTLGQLRFFDSANPETFEFFLPRIIENHQLQLFGRERTKRNFPERDSRSIGLYLGLKLSPAGAVAIFVGTRLSADSLADTATEIYRRGLSIPPPLDHSDADEVGRLAALHRLNLGDASAATRAAQLGVFSHHASIPHGIRLAVEYAMKEGLIRLIICTSTLAQGVNLPLRYLVITTAQQGTERIKTRDFHNLMGRAGRAGIYTEGTIIFSDLRIFDGKNDRNDRWRWGAATDLLNPSNSEECKSALLTIFDPIKSSSKQNEHLVGLEDFLAAHEGGPEAQAQLTSRLFTRLRVRNVGGTQHWTEAGILDELRAKFEIFSAIESFLMANWHDDGDENWIQTLAESTLAYHTADPAQRVLLVRVFDALATNIEQTVPSAEVRRLFAKNLLGVAESMEIRQWVTDNLAQLTAADSNATYLALIWPLLRRFIANTYFVKCTVPDALAEIAAQWINGDSFDISLAALTAADARIGERRPTILHIVDICESGFGFDGMLIIGSIADNLEELSPEQENVVEDLRDLQKKIRYGLADARAIMLYEMGFADRAIAQSLAESFSVGRNRQVTIRRLRQNEAQLRPILEEYPRYFTMIFDSLIVSND